MHAKSFHLCSRVTDRVKNDEGKAMLDFCTLDCFLAWHTGQVGHHRFTLTSLSQEQTYIVAPGENRAPFRWDAGACGAVETWPGLIGIYWDDGGTVRVAWGSRCLRATRKGQTGREVNVWFDMSCFTTFNAPVRDILLFLFPQQTLTCLTHTQWTPAPSQHINQDSKWKIKAKCQSNWIF